MKQLKNKVSIIVPVHNDYHYLKENLIPSLALQEVDYELIVVDDASSDVEDLSLYKDIEEHIDIYKILKEHVGANYARTKGFRKASGDFIIFCDADIFFYSGAIEKMLSVIEDNDSDFVYSDFLWSSEEHCKIFPLKGRDWDVSSLYEQNYISFVSMVRKGVAERAMPLDKTIDRLQDWDFWLTLAEKGYSGKHIKENLFIAILKEGGISGGDKEDYLKWKQVVQKKHGRLGREIYNQRRTRIK